MMIVAGRDGRGGAGPAGKALPSWSMPGPSGLAGVLGGSDNDEGLGINLGDMIGTAGMSSRAIVLFVSAGAEMLFLLMCLVLFLRKRFLILFSSGFLRSNDGKTSVKLDVE